MKFTVSQSTLSDALSIVAKGIAGTSTLPILSGVLVDAHDGVLELRTSNLTISVRHRIAAHIEESGQMVVPCKMLASITKTLPDAPIAFDCDGRQVHISCEKSTFRLNVLAPEDFPDFPQFALERSVELPCDLLDEMVGRVHRATSKDKTRQVFTGIYMTVENNMLRLVATDSYRLAVCDTQVETSSLEGEFELNVPAAAFTDALHITGGEGSMLIGSTDTQVVFVAGNTTYVSRRIEGNYVDYRRLIPASCTTSVKVDVAELSAALKRVAVVAQGNSTVRFEVDADAGILSLSAMSSDQDAASESVDVEATGESGVIAFNTVYVSDCLSALSHDKEISLELQSYSQPGVFKSYGKMNYLYLLMPVRIN